MHGIGDLLLASGIILVTSGLIGIFDGELGVHRIVAVGAGCVVVGYWIHRRRSGQVPR
jgi:hypothetical protein